MQVLNDTFFPLWGGRVSLERDERGRGVNGNTRRVRVCVCVWAGVTVLVKCLIFATCFSICHQSRVTNPTLFPK